MRNSISYLDLSLDQKQYLNYGCWINFGARTLIARSHYCLNEAFRSLTEVAHSKFQGFLITTTEKNVEESFRDQAFEKKRSVSSNIIVTLVLQENLH